MAEQVLNQGNEKAGKIYEEAAGLEEAAECVLRFERKVAAYRSAAKKFRSVSGYSDAGERAQKCMEQAEALEREGLQEVYALGKKKEQAAKTKSEYLDAITEFKRVWKRDTYAEKAKKHIDACKNGILRIETKSIWKKRLIALAVLAVMALIFINTDAYPFTKGMVRQAMGDYKASIADFRAGEGVPWAKGKIKKSYLYLGQQYLKKGDKEAALRAFRKAGDTLEAPSETAKLEQEFLSASAVKEEVRFGKGRWLVLEKTQDSILLLYQKTGKRMVYSQDEADCWEDTKVCHWLNKEFVNSTLSEEERELSCANSDGDNREQTATLLTQAEWEKYREILGEYRHNWWLKDAGLSAMGASYVDQEGNWRQTYVNSMFNCVRPAIWVKLGSQGETQQS